MANEIKATLRALHGGAFTQITLSGPIVSAPPPASSLRRLFSQLAFWSGYPVHVVLSVNEQAKWLETWAAALAAVPERHLRIEFRLVRGRDEQ
jgi:hypothetical protein